MEKVIAREISYAKQAAPSKACTPTSKKSAVRKLWDNYEEVAVVQKTDRLRFVVAAGCREGYRCISIREFYHRQRDDAWVPGRDGIMIPIAAPIGKTRRPDPNNPPKLIYPMQEILLALQQAIEVVMDMDLDDPEKAVWIMPKVSVSEAQEVAK